MSRLFAKLRQSLKKNYAGIINLRKRKEVAINDKILGYKRN